MSSISSPKLPSERSFGLLFTVIFAGVGVYGFFKGWAQGTAIAFFVAGFSFGLITILAPRFLAPLNKAWFQLGQLLGRIINPIVLSIIFFGLLTPVALITRLFGRDALKLRPRTCSSYWVERNPPGPASDSFKNQF